MNNQPTPFPAYNHKFQWQKTAGMGIPYRPPNYVQQIATCMSGYLPTQNMQGQPM